MSPVRRLVSGLGLALAAVTVALVGAVAAAPAAQAHDVLHDTSPAAGASVATVPDAVVLTFDQPALAIGSTLRVTGPSGDVQRGAPVLVDDTVTQALAPGAVAGSYRVAWRVTSADGHPVSGDFTFTAGAANPRAPAPSSPASATSPSAAAVAGGATASGGAGSASSVVITVAIVLLVGGAVAYTRRRRGAPRRPGDGPS